MDPQSVQRDQHKRKDRKRNQDHARTLGFAARAPVVRPIRIGEEIDELACDELPCAPQCRGEAALGPLAGRVCEQFVLDGRHHDGDERCDERGS